MLPSYEKTVTALAYTLVRLRCGDDGDGALFPHNRVARYLLEAGAAMPDFLRPLLRLGTRVLDASALPSHGRLFHRLPPEARARRVEAWRRSRLRPVRDLLRFYEALAVFAWHADRHEHPA